tara:strand:- start:22 stop:231 length:210 start_codon:yes stop_codon:yes gene_type:complete
MARYKLVNGERIKFTKAEEKARDKEEKQGLIDLEKKIQEKETKKAKKESGRQKLKDLGLDDDEIDALIN